MQKKFSRTLLAVALALSPVSGLFGQKNVIDEVIWMVGDEPILKSDVENQKLYLMSEGHKLAGNYDCYIPEQIAVQKLFLNQAKIDSIQVDDAQVNRYVETWLNNAVSNYYGTREKMEEYFNKKYSQIREDQRRIARNSEIVRQMQYKIAQNVKVSPSEVRSFVQSTPVDSLPYIPTSVEVQAISIKPEIALAEIDAIKDKLRGFASEVSKGNSEFSTLARLYSEDKRTALQGGEYGYVGRASLDPDFANVVFNMPSTDRYVSQVIKTEEGYHIVQLIDKKGDLINFRQILLRPQISDQALEAAVAKLDSLRMEVNKGQISFEDAVRDYSEDKDSRNNGGLLLNTSENSELSGSPSFRYEDLPQDLGKDIYKMKPGEISQPIVVTTKKGNKEVVIVKLKTLKEGHRADLVNDFQVIKEMALSKKRQSVLDEWVRTKQKETYVYMNPEYRNCEFQYPGWLHHND